MKIHTTFAIFAIAFSFAILSTSFVVGHVSAACTGNPHDADSGPTGNPHDAGETGNPHDTNGFHSHGEADTCNGSK
jgi:hypothetical protein